MTTKILTRAEARRQGMRQSIRRFAVKYDMQHGNIEPGTCVVECVNKETGEVNSYICYDKNTAKYIANTWWQLQDKEDSVISLIAYYTTHQPTGVTLVEKHVSKGVASDKMMGNEIDWWYLYEAQRLYGKLYRLA